MPTIAYEAMIAAGKSQKGTIDASSSDDAMQKLRGDGLYPTAVREQKGGAAKPNVAPDKKKKKKGGFSLSFGGVPLKRMCLFTRQLSTLQDAGLPLLRSLQILESQQKPGKLKSILGTVCEDVEGGKRDWAEMRSQMEADLDEEALSTRRMYQERLDAERDAALNAGPRHSPAIRAARATDPVFET